MGTRAVTLAVAVTPAVLHCPTEPGPVIPVADTAGKHRQALDYIEAAYQPLAAGQVRGSGQ